METLVNSTYLTQFGVQAYHDRGVLGAGVKVYVIDTGLNHTDADLANIILENFSGTTVGSKSPHGSATAGMIAAGINGYGMVGIAPEATVYLADVDDASGDIWDSNVVAAIQNAVSLGVDIISMSLSGTADDPALRDAVAAAVAAGILVFAAAGNSGRVQYEYPSSYPGVISVGSCNAARQISSFSTRNDKVSVIAPGENWMFPNGSGGYITMSGTSFSCPFAAGLAALQLSELRSSSSGSGGSSGSNAAPVPTLSRSTAVAALNSTTVLNTLNLLPMDLVTPSGTNVTWVIIAAIFLLIVLAMAAGGHSKV